jgi:hypothetical protein
MRILEEWQKESKDQLGTCESSEIKEFLSQGFGLSCSFFMVQTQEERSFKGPCFPHWNGVFAC